MCAGVLGLWLIWPQPDDRAVDHRDLWQKSLVEHQKRAEPAVAEPEPAVEAESLPLDTSGSISAKRHLASRFRTPAALPLSPFESSALAAASLDAELQGRPTRAEDREDSALRAVIREQGEAIAFAPRPDATRLETPADREEEVADAPAARAERQTAERQEAGAEADLEVAALPAFTPGRDLQPASRPAWLHHAALPPRAYDRPMIAVVIDDLGMNRRNTALLNQLEAPLTLAFLPYAGALEQQARAARAAGHELLLHMPMEPEGPDWPGPDALLTTLSPDEFRARLNANLGRFEGFVGLNNHMGSLLTTDRGQMGLLMAELRRRSLMFLDSKTSARSVGRATAEAHGVPFVQRDVFLDNEVDLGHVLRQLELTERIAHQRGAAVAIGHPHDVTIRALRRWLPTLEERGLVLVPVSTVVAWANCPPEAPPEACATGTRPAPSLAGGASGRQG